MRVSISGKNERILLRGAAVLLLGGLTAGCSSSAMRFGDMTDGLFTGSTANQRQIISNNQPYPGDQQAAASSSATRSAIQPVDVSAGQVSRSALPPVGSAPVATAKAAVDEQVTAQTQKAAAKVAALDQTATGTIQAAAPAIEDNIKGWSRAGGTQVTAKEGETVYNLSRRFGVPADIIMKMNGISAENGLRTGQKIVIPTYVYSAKAGVSAPDNDPKTAEAKSSRGTQPADKPKPLQPADVAVLPSAPKVKETETTSAESSGAKPATADGTYTVVDGDSLSKIARKTGVGVTALKEVNGLKDGNIRIGQVLKLKSGGKSTATADARKPANVDTDAKTASIPSTETKPGAAKVAEYTPPKKAIEEAAQESDAAAPESTGIGRMRWPVRGKVVSGYGSNGGSKNDGIDISVPAGTPVKAAENGVVIYAGDGLKEFGNTVLVRHENGLVTVYGHASELKVQRGQKVKRGDEIAVSGMSGNAKSPKLHFEVRKNSAPVDPKGFLE
jgi:murein DD-endopeptidase MepM/ murein hydrolase activator NlpD